MVCLSVLVRAAIYVDNAMDLKSKPKEDKLIYNPNHPFIISNLLVEKCLFYYPIKV